MQASITDRLSNPFATRWVRPGAIPYLYPDGIDGPGLIRTLKASGWRGAIVGPHGSGKSTLLATLVPEIRRSGHDVRLFEMHDGNSRIAPENLHSEEFRVLVIDGYEQLSRWSRWRLGRLCHRRDWGLLVTAHEETSTRGLPTLIHTSGDLATVEQIVDHYLPTHGGVDRAQRCRDGFYAALRQCSRNTFRAVRRVRSAGTSF